MLKIELLLFYSSRPQLSISISCFRTAPAFEVNLKLRALTRLDADLVTPIITAPLQTLQKSFAWGQLYAALRAFTVGGRKQRRMV